MAVPLRAMNLVDPRLPAAIVAGLGLALAAASLPAQTPPVRGGASGELRTPSGFSPIELRNSPANAAGPAPADRPEQRTSTTGKTPIRREAAAADDDRPARNGVSSPWTTLGALAIALVGLFAATRLLRRVSGRSSEALPPHLFDVVASRRLDGQASIHLVRIGRRIVAVGASPAGVQPLTTIDDPLEVEELAGSQKSEVRPSISVRRSPSGDLRTRTSDLRPAVAASHRSGGEVRDA